MTQSTLGLILISAALCVAAQTGGYRRISLAELRDKIEGGWAGQMIGVSYGAPTEFRAQGKINESELPKWTPERVSNSLDQDDLYVEMTLAKVLDEKGLGAATADFGAVFQKAQYPLWHANLAARRNLKRGVPAVGAGAPYVNAHAHDIDFQIEADFIGLMAPGLPQATTGLALKIGQMINHGDGIYGGVFIASMYAAAFFESDPRTVVEAGLACLPRKSRYAKLVRDVLTWSAQYPQDWKRIWKLIQDKWDQRDACPKGALKPYNIDANINGGYVVLGLLYGRRDFGKTIEIATRSGQDSDCNPSTAGGILGAMLGYRRIPEEWRSGIPAIAGKKFAYTDFSFRSIVESTQKRAIALVAKYGGRLEGDQLVVKAQKPKPAPLDVWDDYGSPVERIPASDARWNFQGGWRTQGASRISNQKGAAALISFEGTGGMICGPLLPSGGKAEAFLDGELERMIDVYPDEDATKPAEALWHTFGLRRGKHTVVLVVQGQAYPGSKGADVAIEDLVVFR
jgi:hypothetical protein